MLSSWQAAIGKNLVLMDLTSLPCAVIVLGLVIKSAKMLIVPLCNIGITMFTATLIMYPVSFKLAIAPFCPGSS